MEQISHSCLMSWEVKAGHPMWNHLCSWLILSLPPAFDWPEAVVVRLTLCPDCVSCQPFGTQLYFPTPLLSCTVDHIIFFHPWIYFLPTLLRVYQKYNSLWSFISSWFVACLPLLPPYPDPGLKRFLTLFPHTTVYVNLSASVSGGFYYRSYRQRLLRSILKDIHF